MRIVAHRTGRLSRISLCEEKNEKCRLPPSDRNGKEALADHVRLSFVCESAGPEVKLKFVYFDRFFLIPWTRNDITLKRKRRARFPATVPLHVPRPLKLGAKLYSTVTVTLIVDETAAVRKESKLKE